MNLDLHSEVYRVKHFDPKQAPRLGVHTEFAPVRRNFHHVLRIVGRWVILSTVLSALLFAAAGTIRITSLRAYLGVFSTVLLITMLAVDPQLARERSHPGSEAGPNHLRFAAGFLFLLTLITAAFFAGRMSARLVVPTGTRWLALSLFIVGSSLQLWAMVANPFFSPVIRMQNERGHRLIESGPYRFIRHPGYLAMCLCVPTSALAIGSWLALIPAAGFIFVIHCRVQIEDQFLRINLPGYAQYVERVPAGLPFARST